MRIFSLLSLCPISFFFPSPFGRRIRKVCGKREMKESSKRKEKKKSAKRANEPLNICDARARENALENMKKVGEMEI